MHPMKSVIITALNVAALFVLPGLASAAEKSLTVTLSAGSHDRNNSPVAIPLTKEQSLDGAQSATVELNGKKLTAQATGPSLLAADGVAQEVVFIAPSLQAGQTVTAKLTLSTKETTGEQFQWQDESGKQATLSFGDRPVLRYMYETFDPNRREETYKVFHHVFSPDGSRIVTKGPGGKYTHHRGLFFGFKSVSYAEGKTRCDIWHCKGATQQHAEFVSSDTGPVLGRHRVKINWVGPEDKPFATELREMTAYNTPDGTLIDFASRLTSEVGPVKLDGDPQHAGFHFRADNEVAAKTNKQTYYLRPDGKDAPGKTRNWSGKDSNHKNLDWNCMSFVLGDQRYSTLYMDRPENPKEARYSERDYGRFGSYFVYELTEDNPLQVNYRVWLQEGELTSEQANQLDDDLDEPITVKVN